MEELEQEVFRQPCSRHGVPCREKTSRETEPEQHDVTARWLGPTVYCICLWVTRDFRGTQQM